MVTYPKPVQDLEPGDVYLINTIQANSRRVESREVLGVLVRSPMGGAVVEVRADDGNVFKSHMNGSVNVIQS